MTQLHEAVPIGGRRRRGLLPPFVHPAFDATEQLGVEQRREQLLTLLCGRGPQHALELTLRQHDDAAELVVVEADQLPELTVDLEGGA